MIVTKIKLVHLPTELWEEVWGMWGGKCVGVWGEVRKDVWGVEEVWGGVWESVWGV